MPNTYTPATVLRTSFHRARLDHECDECGGEIRPPSMYMLEAIAIDGLFKAHRTCGQCEKKRTDLLEEHGSFTYGLVCEEHAETFRE